MSATIILNVSIKAKGKVSVIKHHTMETHGMEV
jgi:imidazoleglycerol phosphate dehydratase HisB